MRTKLFGLIGIVLLLLVVELLARGCLDYHVSKSIMNKTANVRKVTVASGDVPVVFYEGVLGHISNGSITMHDIVADPISMAQLGVSASKIDLSRGSLISSKAKITGTPPYLLTVILSKENLRQVINRPVTFHSSYVQTSVDNHVIDAQPQVDGRFIVLKDGKNTVRIPMPSTDYLPCQPTGVGVNGALQLSCASSTLPKFLADATR